MNIPFKAFFAKKKKIAPPPAAPPEPAMADDLNDEYTLDDDTALPAAATTSNSFSVTAPPRTTFNKTLVLSIVAAVLLISGITFIYAMQTQKPQKRVEEVKDDPRSANAKAEFGSLPGTYGSIKDQQKDAKPSLKNPAVIPAAPTGKLPQAPQVPVGQTPQISLAEREALAARNSAIGFGNQNNNSQPSQSSAMVNPFLQQMAAMQAAAAQAAGAGGPAGAPDSQDQKLAFFEKNRSSAWYVKGRQVGALSEYEVKAGSVIPGVMLTGIKSDLPGNIVAQVAENVFDTQTGQFLLIPQGTKILGTYDSKITYGQDRVMLVWTRMIFPNGESLDIENMPGTDGAGYSGLADKVNNHTGRLVTGILLGSVATAAANIGTGNSNVYSVGQSMAQGAAANVANAMAELTRKNLNVQPTVEIRPGWKFQVFVNKDLILKPYEE